MNIEIFEYESNTNSKGKGLSISNRIRIVKKNGFGIESNMCSVKKWQKE